MEKLDGIMLKVSKAMLSAKFVNCFTRRFDRGFDDTGCCALQGMASNREKINIKPKDFNSSSFSDIVMAVSFYRSN